MKKLFMALVLVVASVGGMTAQNLSEETIPMDKAVRKGTLPNGLTYYIRHNAWPEKRAFFYIAQKVGSLQEEDNQRGLAHFLEHMCFNGTTNFPGNQLKTYLEGIGVRFGENLNAYTSFDETVYNIDNVNVETAGAIDKCLLILHDWSHDLLLTDKEIDSERGVINEEWRMRSSAMMRMYEKALPVVYPDSRYGYRLPIGTMDVVMHFPYEALRSYYRKWYRPDLQAIVIVGDIDVDEMEQKIQKTFADIKPAAADAAKFEYFPVSDNKEPIVSINKDKEQGANIFILNWKTAPYPREAKDKTAYEIYGLQAYAMASMFSERIDEILHKENPPFLGADFGLEDFFVSKTKAAYAASVTCEKNKYEQGIKALYREILRAKRYGFSEAEFNRFKAEYLSQAESMYLQRDKVQSASYVEECVRNFLENEPMAGIEWNYEFAKRLMATPQFNVDEVNALLRAMPSDNMVVIGFGSDKEDNILPAKEDILRYMAEVEAEDIEAPADKEDNRPLISNLPAPGTVTSITDDKFGAKLITLSNGVRVHVKKTDFAPNIIKMSASSKGGTSLYSDAELDQTKNLDYAGIGGWGDFSINEINKKLAGIQAGVSTSVTARGESVQGSCAKKDFETMMQLTYLKFTSPRKDVEAFNSAMQRTKAMLKNQENNPSIALQDTVAKVAYANRPRALRTRAEDMDRVNYDRVMEIYKERFADANDFEFFLVGDLDADTIAPLLAKYLGALPVLKGSEKSKFVDLNMVPGEHENVFEKQMETPNAIVLFMYNAPMKVNLKNTLLVSMLQQAMDMKYTESVREDEGGAYGVPVNAYLADYPDQRAVVQIQLPTAPDKRERMTELVYKGVDEMADDGPSADDLKKMKEYMLRLHEESLKSNDYWLRQMTSFSVYGEDNVTNYTKVLNSITVEDVKKAAKTIFRSGNRIEVGMTTPVE